MMSRLAQTSPVEFLAIKYKESPPEYSSIVGSPILGGSDSVENKRLSWGGEWTEPARRSSMLDFG
jgi:hypothetical protein